MTGSRWPFALVALIVGVALGAGGFSLLGSSDDDAAAEQDVAVETTLVAAEQRDLQRFDEWAGTLQPGPTSSVGASGRGTLTRTVDEGTTIAAGDVVAEIDGTPVIALYGQVPQFRVLNIEAQPGADIAQLEENLVALGFDPNGAVTVDDTFTTATAELVLAWEQSLGLATPDGTVDAGQIAFIAGPSEVTSRTPVGTQVNAGQQILGTVTIAESGFVAASVDDEGQPIELTLSIGDEVSGDDVAEGATVVEALIDPATATAGQPLYRWEADLGSIQLAADVDEASTFEIGRTLQVELPDGQVVDASVTDLSDVARSIQNGNNTTTVIDVTVQPDQPLESIFTAGPVTIRVETDRTDGAVLVPASALIALAEGGHAVEVDGRGLIGVELGAFDQGWVEIIDGSVDAGESVVVPT